MGNAYVRFLESGQPSIVEVFNGYRPPTRHQESPTPLDPVDTVRDVFTDGTLSYIPSRFDFSDNLVRALKPDPKVLAQYITEHFQEKDIVLIDCPPTESVFTRAAYRASRYVLVPVRPEYFATIGFPLLSTSLDSFRSENPSRHIEVIGIVINNGDIREFCRIHDVELAKSSSRMSSIPRIFMFLAVMDTEQITKLLDDGTFSGPTRLAPIADAIRSRSAGRSQTGFSGVVQPMSATATADGSKKS